MTAKQNITSPAPVHHWLPTTFLPVNLPEIVNPGLAKARRHCATLNCQVVPADGERFYDTRDTKTVPDFFCFACALKVDKVFNTDHMTLDLSDHQIRVSILLERAGVGTN